MSFLDRFKPQPRWKHADPAVRAAAVPRFRTTPSIRRDRGARARRRGRARAAGGHRARRERRGARGPGAIRARRGAAPRGRANGSSRSRPPRRRPTPTPRSRSTGSRIPNSCRPSRSRRRTTPCARRRSAACTTSRRSAASRGMRPIRRRRSTRSRASADAAELLNIASRPITRTPALPRSRNASSPGRRGVDERATLESVSARAKNKSVSSAPARWCRRWTRPRPARRLALEQWQQRVAAVLARVEAIAANPSVPDAAGQLAGAETEWRDVAGAGTFELDPDTAGRFGALVEAARAAIADFRA